MTVTERWRSRLDPTHVFCFTTDNKVIRTNVNGKNKKVLRVTRSGVLTFSGLGSVATIGDFKARFNDMAGWEKLE